MALTKEWIQQFNLTLAEQEALGDMVDEYNSYAASLPSGIVGGSYTVGTLDETTLTGTCNAYHGHVLTDGSDFWFGTNDRVVVINIANTYAEEGMLCLAQGYSPMTGLGVNEMYTNFQVDWTRVYDGGIEMRLLNLDVTGPQSSGSAGSYKHPIGVKFTLIVPTWVNE